MVGFSVKSQLHSVIQKVFIVAVQSLSARASGLFSLTAMSTASLENIFQLCTAASPIKILLNGIVYF